MSVSERNPCIATKKEMEPREPVVTYNGEDRSEAELRAGVRVFCLCIHYPIDNAMSYDELMHTGFLRTYVLREGYATRIPFRQASTVRGFGFVFFTHFLGLTP